MPKNLVKNEIFTCQYCNKSFKRERTLESHSCEPRRRFRAKDEKSTQIAFRTYQKFYKFSQHRSVKTFEDFIKSPYYGAFIKYGEYCIRTKVISIPRYSQYLIKKEIPINKWNMDSVYEQFILQYIKIESVEDALQRTIKYCVDWGEKTSNIYNEIFYKASTPRIIQGIKYGRISPWVLYLSSSGNYFLEHLQENEQNQIWDIIEPDFWVMKFNDNEKDVLFVKQVLEKDGW